MSKWINNKKILKRNLKKIKPCKKLGYCPFGQLVEEYPIHEVQVKYARKHNLWVKMSKKDGWVKCKKTDRGASEDINEAIKHIQSKFACKTFGHDCPMFYQAEDITE